jgi:hypothetical protein
VAGRSPLRRDRPPIGQQFSGVLEHDYPVAQQAPALLWKRGYHVGGVPVDGVRLGTVGVVETVHRTLRAVVLDLREEVFVEQ